MGSSTPWYDRLLNAAMGAMDAVAGVTFLVLIFGWPAAALGLIVGLLFGWMAL